MKIVTIILILLPAMAKAGGMAAGSDQELAYIYIALVVLTGILYYVHRVLKNYWTKSESKEVTAEEKPE